jgi:hypothetical protein
MKNTGTRARLMLGATVLLALLVVPIALAAKNDPHATAAAVTAAKFKKLKQQVTELQQKVDALQLQPGPQGPEGPQGLPGQQGIQGQQGPSALRLDYDQPNTADQNMTIGTQNELTLEARCFSEGGGAGLQVFVTSSVNATISFTKSVDTGGTATVSNGGFATDSTGQVLESIGTGTGFVRSEMRAIYRNANRVIALDLHMIANGDTERCQLQGTAVPAS